MSYYRPHAMTYEYGSSMTPTSVVAGETDKVEYSETEGFQIWYKDMKYPTNGIFDPEAQAWLDNVKRYIRNELKFASHHPVRALSYLSKKFRTEWIAELESLCFMNLHGFIYQPAHWTRAVKEIYKGLYRFPKIIRETICLFFENDKPYRYRIQEVLGTLNLMQLEENPRKEIFRMIDQFVSRDGARDWKPMARLLKLSLYLPKVLDESVLILSKIDPNVISLDSADLYNSLINGMENEEIRYHFFGLSNEQMINLHKTL